MRPLAPALRTNRDLADGNLSPDALVLLISVIPKFLNLEKGIAVQTAHLEVVDAVERYLRLAGAEDPIPETQAITARVKPIDFQSRTDRAFVLYICRAPYICIATRGRRSERTRGPRLLHSQVAHR
jgi:hypothetical protein